MFRSQANLAAERARRSKENYKRWAEDVGRVARSSLDTGVPGKKVKVCLQSSAIDAEGCRRVF